jgi:ABC-2 type transport system permease protein
MAKVKTMLRNVFLKSLRDQRRSLMFWGIGVAALSLVTALFYPSFKEVPELSELFEQSEALARVFAGGFTDLTSPEGYLNSQLYSLLGPILFLIFTIGQGSGAIAGEEEKGTLDIMLSNPTTRLQVLIQKFAALAVATSVLALVLWLSVVIGGAIVDMDLSLWRTAQATFSGLLLGVLFGALALMLGSASGKRGLSTGIAGALALGTYFIYALVPLVDGLESAEKVFPFYYYIGADPLTNGLNLAHAAVLIGITAALLAVAIVTFERRDLAV